MGPLTYQLCSWNVNFVKSLSVRFAISSLPSKWRVFLHFILTLTVMWGRMVWEWITILDNTLITTSCCLPFILFQIITLFFPLVHIQTLNSQMNIQPYKFFFIVNIWGKFQISNCYSIIDPSIVNLLYSFLTCYWKISKVLHFGDWKTQLVAEKHFYYDFKSQQEVYWLCSIFTGVKKIY